MKILIIGGYGNVGSKIVSILYSLGTYSITVAGRNLRKAREFASFFKDDVNYAFFDANDFHNNTNLILGHDIILLCIDLADAKLGQFILENGKVYLDLTANNDYVKKLENLNVIAQHNGGLAIISVGLMPGLSNLVVKHLARESLWVEKAEIFLQLGLCEKNGKAAVKWILNNINNQYKIVCGNKVIVVSPFEKGKRETVFKKKIQFYPFNFSDQYVLQHILNIPTVISFLGFDSNLTSIVLSFFKRIGFFKLLKYRPVYNLVLFLFSNIHFGSATFRLKVNVYSASSEIHTLSITGKGEALITAQVACQVVQWVCRNKSNLPRGIKSIEQVLSYSSIQGNLDITEQKRNTLFATY